MAIIGNHNLDDRPCWKQASERMGYWSLQSVPVAGLDRNHWHMGLAADELRPLVRLRAQPLEME